MSTEKTDQTGGDTALIERILADARGEAKKILAEAESSVASRRDALAKRLAQIDEETTARVAEERETLRARTDAAIALAEGRARLRIENRVYDLVRERCLAAMAAMRGKKEYAGVLRDWIAEAALGLGSPEALVRCPAEDRAAVEPALAEARKALNADHGTTVGLTLDDTPLAGQGVALRDPRGRLSFTNTVADRLRRFAGEIRRIVYHSVIEGIHGRTDHR
jgi:vacuolar-type H+-ATPase subunit E/Vma4